MRFNTLQEWLEWQESLHPDEIELGLERIRKVWDNMYAGAITCPVITVSGTNGKGSSIAMLDSIYKAAGYRTGVYTSPHLLRYNERIKVNGVEVSDEMLCAAFEAVDQARKDISLTYFEFGTLAAFWVFVKTPLDVMILEVGMGGRLDAVNILDPDVSLLTSVALDHQAWLGDTREKIGFEKAGIFRPGRPAVIGDPEPPESVLKHADEIHASVYCFQKDFDFTLQDQAWDWKGPEGKRAGLPFPALRGKVQLNNAAAVIMVVQCLSERLPVSQNEVRQGLLEIELPGRFQVVPGDVPIILDVSHNPAAVEKLRENLQHHVIPGKTLAVVALLGDKDIEPVAACLADEIDQWYAAGLEGSRALPADQLAERLRKGGARRVNEKPTVKQALEQARQDAAPGDRILVFGSFLTVAEAMDLHV